MGLLSSFGNLEKNITKGAVSIGKRIAPSVLKNAAGAIPGVGTLVGAYDVGKSASSAMRPLPAQPVAPAAPGSFAAAWQNRNQGYNSPYANAGSTTAMAPVRPPVPGRAMPPVNTGSNPARPFGVNAAQASGATSGANQGAGASTFNRGVNSNGDAFPGFSSQNGSNYSSGNAQSQNSQTLGSPDVNQPDRFAQIDALIKNASGYFQPSEDEQNTMTQLGNLATSRDLGLAKINNTPEPLDLLTGQSDFLAKQAAAQSQPLQTKLGILQARRQAAIQGYQSALTGAAAKLGYNQPVPLGLGTALVDPNTGNSIAGNASYAGSGGSSLINSAIQQLKNGASYNDVAGQLPGGLSATLLSEAQKQIPGFNITKSNQQASAQGSALTTAANNATPLVNAQKTALEHIDNIANILKSVNFSNIPLINRARIFASNNISSDPNIRQLQSEVNVVRGEIAKVLAGTGASTDSARAEAEQIIPDNISPEQFANVGAGVKQLMQQKIDQYTNLSNAQLNFSGGQASGRSSGGTFGW